MTMSFQAHDGHTARSEDLHRHILRSHLAYLNQEETPAKLEQRRNLESLITEFLCVVSHSAKFTFIEVANILNYSILKNPNFSAYKAQSAFEALEKYATNLISHPWRKEYKTIKLYSGFYKHSVESQLLQGNSVFHLLGYQYTEDGVLYLDEPVDPDKVARVALDCLTAYVECQVMVQICEKIKSFKCTWIEIRSIREDYVCGIDEAVRLLHQLKRNALEQDKHDRWLRNQENGSLQDKKDVSSNYPKTGILVDVSNTWPSDDKSISYGENSILSNSSVSDGPYKVNKSILSHSKLPSWSEGVTSQLSDYQCRNPNAKASDSDNYVSRSFDDHIQSNYSFLNKSNNPVSKYSSSHVIPDSWGDSWDLMQTPLQHGSYYRNDSYLNCDLDSHRTGYNQTVPNVKETYSSQFGHMYPPHPVMPLGIPAFPYPLPHDFSIPPRQCQCRACCENQLSIFTNKYNHCKDSSNNFESNLRSIGRPDLNQREDTDICAPFAKMSVDNLNSKSRKFPVSSPYSSYQTANESSEVVHRSDAEKLQHNNCKRGSYYDNVPSTFEEDSICIVGPSLNSNCDFQSNGVISSNTITLSKPRNSKGTSVTDSIVNSHSLKSQKKSYSNASFSTPVEKSDTTSVSNSDLKNAKSNQTAPPKESKGSKKWSCSSCTFYNAPEKSICDMCGRSKHPGPEITPLVSGGRECPQCTLVNKKDSENCTACGASLKDSPTYI